MLNKNPELDALDKAPESSQKTFSPHKQRKSAVGIVLRITFIYFPLGVILAAFTLPFFIGCGGNKAKQSEVKQYVRAMNRAQQAKFAQNGTFANTVEELKLGIKTQTTNFHYSVNATKTAAFNYGIPNKNTYNKKVFFGLFQGDKKVEFRAYVGAIFLVTHNYTKETSTLAITCVAKSPTTTKPGNPIFNNGNPTCADGTDEVGN
ncbi:MAG TPA: type IV pilin-like G/H family protein [Kamptonema sp.]|nr:type IV pilin-like G/H family protein [Kamptonema sp.]